MTKTTNHAKWNYQFDLDPVFDAQKVTLKIDLKEIPQIYQNDLQILIRDTSDPSIKPGIYKSLAILSDETFQVNIEVTIEIFQASSSFGQPNSAEND